jgi:hypothetical protein
MVTYRLSGCIRLPEQMAGQVLRRCACRHPGRDSLVIRALRAGRGPTALMGLGCREPCRQPIGLTSKQKREIADRPAIRNLEPLCCPEWPERHWPKVQWKFSIVIGRLLPMR